MAKKGWKKYDRFREKVGLLAFAHASAGAAHEALMGDPEFSKLRQVRSKMGGHTNGGMSQWDSRDRNPNAAGADLPWRFDVGC